MLKTGLPYAMEDMSKVYEEGAIVDMNNINFPVVDIDRQIRTSFIYLRNTSFNNVTLDFSKCSYESKAKFLIEYLTCDIVFYNDLLKTSWLNILFNKNFLVNKYNSILTEQETIRFINENKEFIEELETFINSLSLYLISLNKLFTLDFKDIEQSSFFLNSNTYSLIEDSNIGMLISNLKHTPKFYSKIFTLENNKLRESCRNLDTYYFLEEMSKMSTSDFQNLLHKINVVI